MVCFSDILVVVNDVVSVLPEFNPPFVGTINRSSEIIFLK